MRILGLDVGGANIKAATTDRRALSLPFALWKAPDQLTDHLCKVDRQLPADAVAVTMTGELCDCFPTKSAGVHHILDAVDTAFSGREIAVYQTDGSFVSSHVARSDPWKTAASNWHALTVFAAGVADGTGLLIDIGSTTTDVIPFRAGKPIAGGRTDPERLATGELVYQGVTRTPLCAILPQVTIGDTRYSTMAELFATTLDVYLLTGELPEQPECVDTADGRPATKEYAQSRLARMVGSDSTRFSRADALELAAAARRRQLRVLARAVGRASHQAGFECIPCLVASGQGEFLSHALREYLRTPIERFISLSGALGPELSKAACAYAVALRFQRSIR